MKHYWNDIFFLGFGFFWFYAGASAAYQNATSTNASTEAYVAWQILALAGGMLIGASVHKIAIKLKKSNDNTKL
jgi:hypothetical protein